MSTLRPLLWMPGAAIVPGGHVVQLKETARALAHLGCEPTELLEPKPSFSGIDIVHGFGLSVDDVQLCRRYDLPVVVSSIYWDRSYRYQMKGLPTARVLAGRARQAGRFAAATLRGPRALIEACLVHARWEIELGRMFSGVDMLLPNAVGEGKAIDADFAAGTEWRVVPNGVDPSRFSLPDTPFESRDLILYVGRIEPHKNQLGLLKALRGTGRRLVIAGFAHPHHEAYVKECRIAASGWAEMRVDPTTDELPQLYRSARVHVVPSWFETTGLVSLEAGLSGCNVVSTERGHAAEYLGEHAWYCDPSDHASIRTAVEQAWNSPPSAGLRERILSRYTWHHVGQATLAAYQAVLARRSLPR